MATRKLSSQVSWISPTLYQTVLKRRSRSESQHQNFPSFRRVSIQQVAQEIFGDQDKSLAVTGFQGPAKGHTPGSILKRLKRMQFRVISGTSPLIFHIL